MSNSRNWAPPTALSKKEQFICQKLKQTGKLFVFLRTNRHLIINDEINQKLMSMYADHPRGKPAVPAALLAMATILQAYEQKSDAGATLEAMFDQRWQMVLDCLGSEESPFSQGTLCDFRHRLIANDMDVVLLEHTVNVAREVGGFSHVQLRVALDSAPLQGAGRVEDTFNLVGHALELVVNCAAQIKMISEEELIEECGLQLVGKSSVKAALDIDWSDKNEKHQAVETLQNDVDALKHWLEKQPSAFIKHKGLEESLTLLEKVLEQNIDPDPDGNGPKVKEGSVPDRQISISDSTMRHGRKSSSRTISGFKQHIAVDLDNKLILATCVRPANEPEHKASEYLKPKVNAYGEVKQIQIDRGYLAAHWTTELYEAGKEVVAKPWTPPSKKVLTKNAFQIDLVEGCVTCPAGKVAMIKSGKVAQARFKSTECNACPKKADCTTSEKGRKIKIHEQEAMLQKLQKYVSTSQGRADARERVKVEHSLASICNRKGPRARYRGLRLNEYDLNRTAVITNLHIAMGLAA
ncbi:DDE transposase [Vibrio navarrensis]|uniref:transposase n=1 Tax=Vibrio navarrensis TaxID=29495 RepID=UPI00186935EF|nr:transposase [Vibrio navarrensis]MBE3656056.1 DDE transposase [Vibrio navarrensis]